MNRDPGLEEQVTHVSQVGPSLDFSINAPSFTHTLRNQVQNTIGTSSTKSKWPWGCCGPPRSLLSACVQTLGHMIHKMTGKLPAGMRVQVGTVAK